MVGPPINTTRGSVAAPNSSIASSTPFTRTLVDMLATLRPHPVPPARIGRGPRCGRTLGRIKTTTTKEIA
ncbi:hypothetical protein NCCP2495_20970 [Dietzia sp. NCCP-2495]|nr:hypothetical protein NCCP2495_20970 [Dietzia sp. NCCP-2495]